MSWDKIGYNKYLIRETVLPSQDLDLTSFPEIFGFQIVDYTSKNFNFVPTSPQSNPKEGDLYYDQTNRKLKVYTGSAYESITST